MELTEKEKQYIQCLSVGMTFEEMMRELNMTKEELGKFGTELLDRILESEDPPRSFNVWTAKRMPNGKVHATLRIPKDGSVGEHL